MQTLRIIICAIFLKNYCDAKTKVGLSDLEETKDLLLSLKRPEPNAGYGLYKADVILVKECHGPKLRNGTMTKFTVTLDGTNMVFGSVDLLQDIDNMIADFRTYRWKNHTVKEVFRYHLNSICDNFLIFEMLAKIYDIDYKTCKTKKGVYEIPTTSINTETHAYLGEQFFYARFAIKVVLYTDDMNVVCVYSVADFKPL